MATGAAVWVACGSSDGVRHVDEGDAGHGNQGGSEAQGGDASNGGSRDGAAGAAAPARDGGNGGESGSFTSFGGAAEGGGSGDTGEIAGAGGEAGAAPIEVSVTQHFNVGSQLCGLAFDSDGQRIWAQPCFGANMLSYSPEGVAGITIAAPGESADDVDVDFTPAAMTLGEQQLPAQTALFFNGETNALEIYAVDPSGDASATLATAFGNGHVVGGAFHAQRGTFFAVQDRVPGAVLGNVVAELNPLTGVIENEFSLQPNIDVNYGDLEVCQSTGHLFVVSSVEDVVAELEPTGELIAKYPAEVAGLAGIAVDDSTGEVWVAAPAGDIWQLRGLPCPPWTP